MLIHTPVASFVRLLGFIVATLVLLWVVSVPHPVPQLTYLLLASVACIVMAVASLTYRNHHAPATAAQVLYEADGAVAGRKAGHDALVRATVPSQDVS